jgi:predicted RNase H-like nuclease (RuvC/YqgF family)
MEAIRSGTRNLEGYYSAINDQQAAETKLLKEANQGLQSMIFELSTENAGLKRQVAENNEELVKLREVKERWEQNAQNLGKIASACRTIEELASLMSAAHEES